MCICCETITWQRERGLCRSRKCSPLLKLISSYVSNRANIRVSFAFSQKYLSASLLTFSRDLSFALCHPPTQPGDSSVPLPWGHFMLSVLPSTLCSKGMFPWKCPRKTPTTPVTFSAVRVSRVKFLVTWYPRFSACFTLRQTLLKCLK